MGVDVFHSVVNNSAFINAMAQMALYAPMEAQKYMGINIDRWKSHADAIYVPYDMTQKYHPQFDGYVKGEIYQ